MDEPIEPVLPDDEGVTPPPLDESVIPSLGISGDQEAIAREQRRAQGVGYAELSETERANYLGSRANALRRETLADLESYKKLQREFRQSNVLDSSMMDEILRLNDSLKKRGIDPTFELRREKVERTNAIFSALTQNIQPEKGLYGYIDTDEVVDNKLGKLLNADQIASWNSADQATKERELFGAIKEVKFPNMSISDEMAAAILMREYKTDSINGVINKYSQDLKRANEVKEGYYKAEADFLPAFLENGGDFEKAIDSLGPNSVYGRSIFNNSPYLRTQYQAAYEATSWIKDEYIKDGSLDWDKMADRLLALGENTGSFKIAIQMLPEFLPKDDRAWLVQALNDTYEDIGSFLRMLPEKDEDEEKFQRLALAIQKEYRSMRDMPESNWGMGVRNLVDNVPKIAAVSLSSLATGVVTRNPVATYSVATAMGSLVYGSSAGLDAYKSNSSREGAIAYGLTVGSLEGALDSLTMSIGGLAVKGVRATGLGSTAIRGVEAIAERSTLARIGRAGAAGALTETVQESIADPVYVGVENLYRSLGADLTQQNTLRDWWENYNPLDPAFFIPTVVLGGSMGALGGVQANHLVNKVGRSPQALIALGIESDVAHQIATMPDGKERSNLIQEALFNATDVNQSPETVGSSSAAMLNFVAKNADLFKNVELMPTFKDNGDGTWDVTTTSPESGQQSTMTLTDEVAGTYLSETLASNPSFVQALNLFAQRQLEPAIESQGIEISKDELLSSIQNAEGINQSTARARALAYIQSNPELREQYNAGEITVEDVANNLEVVSAYRAGQIAVIEGRANPLDILEEVIHANATYDLATGAVTREYIENAIRKYGEYTGRDFGNLSDDVILQEALATMGKALATNPELFGTLPGDVQSILEWQKDNIAEVGNIFKEGQRIKQAIEDGVLDADFVKWSQSLANVADQTQARDIASMINEAAGAAILPSVQERTSALRVGPGIQTVEKAIADIFESNSSQAINSLKAIRKSFMGLAEQAVAGKFSQARQQKALFNSVLTLENAISRYGKSFIPRSLAETLANPKSQLQFENALQTALDRGVKAINNQIQTAEFNRTQREVRKIVDRVLKESSKEEAAALRAEAAQQVKTTEGLERLAKRAYKDRKGVSSTLDAQSRYNTLAVEELMKMSPDEVEAQQDALQALLERTINKTQNPNDPQVIEIQQSISLLDTFGSVLYKDGNSFVRSLAEQENAFDALKQLQDEGRLRWRKELERREQKLNLFKDEVAKAVGTEKKLDDLRNLLKEAGEYNSLKSFFTGMLSTVQLSEILGTLPGFKRNGDFMLNEVVRATMQRDNARVKRHAMISSWLKGAAKLAGIKNTDSTTQIARHFYQMNNAPVKFKGEEYVKTQLIKIYQTMQESDGVKVLRNNYKLDLGNYALLEARISQLDEQLTNQEITQEAHQAEVDNAEEAFQDRLAKDQEALINALGPDGLFLARSIQTAYRELGQRVASIEESFFGQVSTMEDFYTPRTTAHEGQLGDGFYDSQGYTPGQITYSGKPAFMKKRSTPASAEITMLVNPVQEFERYAQIAEGWMSSLELNEYFNKVWLNTKTAAQIQLVIGKENYQQASKGLYNFLNEGRIRAQQGLFGELFVKAIGTLARTKIFNSMASICRSGAAFFNPLVGSDFSSLEIIKSMGSWLFNPQPISLQEMSQLDGVKARDTLSYQDRAVIKAAMDAPKEKQAQVMYWQECGNSALIDFDLWCVKRGNMMAAQILHDRGLKKEQIIDQLNLNILKSAQPENQSTRAIGTLGGSAYESYQVLFMSDMLNKSALLFSQFKRGDISSMRKLANFIRMWTIVGFANTISGMAASFFTSYNDDEFSAETILFNMSLGPLVATPVFAGLFQALDYYAFGGGHVFSRPNTLTDFSRTARGLSQAYEVILKSTEDMDAVTLNEWIEVGAGLSRTLGDTIGLGANIANAKTVGRVFEVISSLSNATLQAHNAAKTTRSDLNPFYDTREKLLQSARRLRKEKREAKSTYGERSVEYRRLSRELRRVNKKLKDNGWQTK